MSKRPPEEPASRKVGYPIGVVGHLSACLLPLGLLFRSLGSPLVIQVPLLRSLGSRLVASAPRRCELAPPKVPQRPVQGPKCTILCSKTNDFAMPPVLQKWSLRVPLGPPKVAPRLPQGPPRATPSPQGLPQEPSGELCPPQRVPPDPPRSTSEQTRGASEINGFTTIKPTFPPRGGAGSMRVKAFGRYWGLFFSSTAPFRLVFGSLGAPRFLFTCSPPLLAANLHLPGSHKTPLASKMYKFIK